MYLGAAPADISREVPCGAFCKRSALPLGRLGYLCAGGANSISTVYRCYSAHGTAETHGLLLLPSGGHPLLRPLAASLIFSLGWTSNRSARCTHPVPRVKSQVRPCFQSSSLMVACPLLSWLALPPRPSPLLSTVRLASRYCRARPAAAAFRATAVGTGPVPHPAACGV